MACIESMNSTGAPRVDWIIKWNPRSTQAAQLAAELDAAGVAWERPRQGKRVATWEQAVEIEGVERPCGACCGWPSARSARVAST